MGAGGTNVNRRICLMLVANREGTGVGRPLDLVDRGGAADRRRARQRHVLPAGGRRRRCLGRDSRLARRGGARPVRGCRCARRRADHCRASLAARPRNAAAAAVARRRADGPRPDVEPGWQRTRGLPRLGLGCRTRGARRAARRNHVHRRHARLGARAVRPPTARGHERMPRNWRALTMWFGSSLFTVALFVVALIVIAKAIRVVPQQHAWIVERLGRFYAVLQPGLNFVIPVRRPRRVPARPARDPARRAEPDLHHQGQHAAAGRRHPVLPGDRPEARVLRLVAISCWRSRSSRRRRCAA